MIVVDTRKRHIGVQDTVGLLAAATLRPFTLIPSPFEKSNRYLSARRVHRLLTHKA
jgi:hypothetical protein